MSVVLKWQEFPLHLEKCSNQLSCSCLSVRPLFLMSTSRIAETIYLSVIFWNFTKPVAVLQSWLKSGDSSKRFTRTPTCLQFICAALVYSLLCYGSKKNVRDTSCRKIRNTHFMICFFRDE